MEVKVLNNQSLFDIAIRELGSAEAAFDIALANNIGITDDLQPRQVLQIPQIQSDYVKKQTVDYYKINDIKPATAIDSEINILLEGLEFWAIEYDFTIS
ncbi:MAG: hypothetical protein LBP85_01600 [Prevotellaceae bacterium]|jgi:hypothetical protein|nr:hypothetical protein [Prevotellaceae bacterium]